MRRLLALALTITACVSTPAPTVRPSPATQSPSPTATATAAAASPTPSPPPTPVPQNVRLGIVLFDPAPPFVVRLRTEADPAPFATLSGAGAAVAPEGARFAYWHREPGAPDTTDALRVVDTLSGTEREITKLSGEKPVGIAWRDDGGGLVFSARSPNLVSGGADPPPLYTVVRIIAFATNQVREVKRLDAARFVPLGWNLAARVISGVDLGEGGVTKIYRFDEGGSSAGETGRDPRFNEVDDLTRDNTVILGQFAAFTGGKSTSGVRLVSATDIKPIGERVASDGTVLIRARFRPRTTDVVALLRLDDSQRYALEIWTTTTGAQTTKRVWAGPAAPFASGDLIMRADGKAAYVRTEEAAPARSSWQVVDLDGGTATALTVAANTSLGGPSFFTTDEGIAKLKTLR